MTAPLTGVELTATRALLGSLIDYAGLFPPASHDLTEAARRYAAYRSGPQAWMLGSFVVPARALPQAAAAIRGADPRPETPWSLSVLLGQPLGDDLARLATAREELGDVATVAAVEVAPLPAAEIARVASRLRDDMPVFLEVPLGADLAERLRVIAGAGCCAKVRTGGVVPDAIPEPRRLAEFLVACRSAAVPFKATAGLHHAVRGRHALTYEPGAPKAAMHGFLNLLAAALCAADVQPSADAALELAAILGEEDGRALRVSRRGLDWGRRHWTLERVLEVRRGFFLSFGSCSFTEPISDLAELGLLEPSRVEAAV